MLEGGRGDISVVVLVGQFFVGLGLARVWGTICGLVKPGFGCTIYAGLGWLEFVVGGGKVNSFVGCRGGCFVAMYSTWEWVNGEHGWAVPVM